MIALAPPDRIFAPDPTAIGRAVVLMALDSKEFSGADVDSGRLVAAADHVATALHEAAHFATAVAQGLRCGDVWVAQLSSGKWAGACAVYQPQPIDVRYLAVVAAGKVASRRALEQLAAALKVPAGRYADLIGSAVARSAGADDSDLDAEVRAMRAEWTEREELEASARALAVGLVEREWPAIERLARALMKRGRVGADEAAELMKGARR